MLKFIKAIAIPFLAYLALRILTSSKGMIKFFGFSIGWRD